MSDELLDVRNEQGNITGQVLSRDEVHTKGLWHGVAFVWIYNSNKEVLLQYRASSKPNFPNSWDISAGGHMLAGDSPVAAAVRELYEELHIKVEEKNLKLVGTCNDVFTDNVGDVHRDNVWVFLLKREIDPSELALQVEELTDTKFIPITELENDLKDPERSKNYSGRNRYIYEVAIEAIKAGGK